MSDKAAKEITAIAVHFYRLIDRDVSTMEQAAQVVALGRVCDRLCAVYGLDPNAIIPADNHAAAAVKVH